MPGRKSLLWRLAVPTCLVVALTVAAIGALTPTAVVDAALEDAIQRSMQTAEQMRTLRSFYSEHVVAAAVRSGTKASATYKSEPSSIPVPTTFHPGCGAGVQHGLGQGASCQPLSLANPRRPSAR